MVQTVTPHWNLEVERGPGCLVIRPGNANGVATRSDTFAHDVWAILEQHLTYRLVLEMDRIELLYSALIGQLVLLSKRLSGQGGMLRLCALSPGNQMALDMSKLRGVLPIYANRNEAALGIDFQAPRQPR